MRATLLRSHPVTDRDTLYVFECPEIAQKARPGQFVELKLTDGVEPYLRRPISIFDADGEFTFSLLVRTVGTGTAMMTRWEPGKAVDVIGPLGNGFSWEESDEACLLVAGGIGLAPMHYLIRALQKERKQIRILFSPKRDADLLKVLSGLEPMETHFVANRGELPTVLSALLSNRTDLVFACGPEGLLEAVAETAKVHGVPSQISMERRMGCGFGICVGCAVAVRTETGMVYKKACKDGPVFSGEEVIFHEES